MYVLVLIRDYKHYFLIDSKFSTLNAKKEFLQFFHSFTSYFSQYKQLSILWTFLIIYQILFVVLPAAIYPLPFQTDMKHHTLFVQMIIDQQTITPSWTPVVPTLGTIFYQLGGHVFTAYGYSLIAFTNVPVVTFVNFWFRFQFLATFYAFVYLTTHFFPEIKYSKIYVAATLLVTPVLFWVTGWGGFSWVFGLFFLVFVI